MMNRMLSAVCGRMGGRFVPLGTFSEDERTGDGIHFTFTGYQDMARRVVSGLAR